MIFKNILETIGTTPLIKLNRITKGLIPEIYVKVEYFNPGGSVKDRIAIKMIEKAEKRGLLKPGGTIIEATAGNTGVGLALVAGIKGYRCIFVMPDKMSEDKINLLKAYGAEVVISKTNVPPDSPESYNGIADRLSKEIKGSFRPDQFSNLNNPLAHYLTTGPEIWKDTRGKIDVFVAGMGTGGTISGVGKFLKEKNKGVKIIGADPEGSILSGDSPKPFKVEGIGEDFIPAVLNRQVIDDMIRVKDKESFNIVRRLAKEEGILVGGSSGTAVSAAIKYARRLNKKKMIVALLPDTGRNYITKIFSDKWMGEEGFLGFYEQEISIKRFLKHKKGTPFLVTVVTQDKVAKAISLMHKYNISQIPVLDKGKVIGSVLESTLMKLFHDGKDVKREKIKMIMTDPMPCLDEKTDASEAYRLLMAGRNGIVVLKNQKSIGVITRIDFINFWMKKGGIR